MVKVAAKDIKGRKPTQTVDALLNLTFSRAFDF